MKNFASYSQQEKVSKWAYLLGFAVYWFATLVFTIPLFIAMYASGRTEITLILPLGQSLLFLLGTVISFVGGIVGIWFVTKFIHKRSFKSVITLFPKIRIKRIVTGFVVMFVLSMLYDVVNYFIQTSNYEIKEINFSRIIMAIAFTLLIPFQAASEEILCRGYLLQGFTRVTSGVASVILQSLVFVAMHLLNPEFENYEFIYTILTYLLTALLFGFIALYDNGIELPIGLHAAMNVYAFAFVSYPHSALPSDTFISIKQLNIQEAFFVNLFFSVVIIFLFKWLYNWSNLKDKLRVYEFKETIPFEENDIEQNV